MINIDDGNEEDPLTGRTVGWWLQSLIGFLVFSSVCALIRRIWQRRFLVKINRERFEEKIKVDAMRVRFLKRCAALLSTGGDKKRKSKFVALIQARKTIVEATAKRIDSLSTINLNWSDEDISAIAADAANLIWPYLRRERQKPIDKQRLREVFDYKHETSVDEDWELLDVHDFGTVDKLQFKEAMLRIYTNHIQLLRTLRDRDSLGRILNHVTSAIFYILLFLVFLIWIDFPLGLFALIFGSIFIGLSFVFGTVLREIFEAILLIFAVAPFDVGDRVVIGGSTLIVDKLHILTTEFVEPVGRRHYIPNSSIFRGTVINLKRSNNASLGFVVQVSMDTPTEKLIELKKRFLSCIRQSPEQFLTEQDVYMNIDRIEESRKMVVELYVTVPYNWHEGMKVGRSRAKGYTFLAQLCTELGISYVLPKAPVQLSKVD